MQFLEVITGLGCSLRVEYLPSMHEVLGWILSTEEKKEV
jgi:hypothetical protein